MFVLEKRLWVKGSIGKLKKDIILIMANTIIWVIFQAISFIVLVDVILSYFMSPYQLIRRALDKIVDPLLAPIRKIVPPVLGFDLSPVILILLLQLLQTVLFRIL